METGLLDWVKTCEQCKRQSRSGKHTQCVSPIDISSLLLKSTPTNTLLVLEFRSRTSIQDPVWLRLSQPRVYGATINTQSNINRRPLKRVILFSIITPAFLSRFLYFFTNENRNEYSTGWRKKTGPPSHCKYSEIPWPNCVEIGELLQYYNAEHSY